MVSAIAWISYSIAKELWEKENPNLGFSMKYDPRKIYLKDFPILFIFNNE